MIFRTIRTYESGAIIGEKWNRENMYCVEGDALITITEDVSKPD